jgi:hypothetical protein
MRCILGEPRTEGNTVFAVATGIIQGGTLHFRRCRGGNKRRQGASSKGDKTFTYKKKRFLHDFKSPGGEIKRAAGAASEPQARAPLRSNIFDEMVYYIQVSWLELPQAAFGLNASRVP